MSAHFFFWAGNGKPMANKHRALYAVPQELLLNLPQNVDEESAERVLASMTADDARRSWSGSGLDMLMQIKGASGERLESLFVGVYAAYEEHQKKNTIVGAEPKKKGLFQRDSGAAEVPASATSAAIVFAMLAFRADILRLSCIGLTDRVGEECGDAAYRRSMRECVNLKHILGGTPKTALGPWSFLGEYKWDDTVLSEAHRVFASCRRTWLDRGASPSSAESRKAEDLLRLVVGADVSKRYTSVTAPSLVPLAISKEEVLRVLHMCDDIRIHAGGAVLSACTVRREHGEKEKGAMAEVDAELKGESTTSIFVPLDGNPTTRVSRYLFQAIESGRVVIDAATFPGCNGNRRLQIGTFKVSDTGRVDFPGKPQSGPEPEACSLM
jgi:hypothetical protein